MLSLRIGRYHEIMGPSATAFALVQASVHAGPLPWIACHHAARVICPTGMASFIDPARLIVVTPASAKEAYWAFEQVLRSGAARMAVAEIAAPLSLTQSRRLQLAAETGGGLGLLIRQDSTSASAAETRWYSTALISPSLDSKAGITERAQRAPVPEWKWELLKNKSGALGQWRVQWRGGGNAPWVRESSDGETSPYPDWTEPRGGTVTNCNQPADLRTVVATPLGRDCSAA